MSKLSHIKDTLNKAAGDSSSGDQKNPNEEFFTSLAPDELGEGQTVKIDEALGKIQIGMTGLDSSGGTITEEWKPELSGGQAIKVYREMSDNDAIVGAILTAIQMLIRQVEWRAQPAVQEGQPEKPTSVKDAFDEEGLPEDETDEEDAADTEDEGDNVLPFGKADAKENPFGQNADEDAPQDEQDELADTEDEDQQDDEFADGLGEAGESQGEPNSEAEANALFLKQCMDDMEMTWAETISEIMSMLVYGWSYHEVVYKSRGGLAQEELSERSKFSDGKLGWRKIPIRAQDTLDRWEFDQNGDALGMWQQPPPDYELRYIPIEKALLFRTSVSKNNPEGKSILRNAYRSYVFKKRFEEIEGVGVERDLAGIPIAFVDPRILDPDASAKDKAILNGIKDIVANIRRDTQDGIIWPRAYDQNNNLLYDLQLLTSGGSRQFNTGEIIDRYDRRMAQSVLADFIMMGHETVGSFALSSSKTRLFAVALGAWMDMITGVFNDRAIPKLFELNGITENLPTLVHTDLEIPDLNELADFISKLAGVGIIFDDDATEDHLRQIAKLPQRPLGETRLRDQIREAREQKALKEVNMEPEDPSELRRIQFEREDQLRAEDLDIAQLNGELDEEETKNKFPPR